MADKSMCKCLTSKFSPHRASKCALKKAGGALIGVGILGAVAAGVAAASIKKGKPNKKEKGNTQLNDQSTESSQSNQAPVNGIPLLNVENGSDLDNNNGNCEVILSSEDRDSPIFVDSEYIDLINEKEKEPSVDKITETLGNSFNLDDNEEKEENKIDDSIWFNIGSSLLIENIDEVKNGKNEIILDQDIVIDAGKNNVDELLENAKRMLSLQEEEIKSLDTQIQLQQVFIAEQQTILNDNETVPGNDKMNLLESKDFIPSDSFSTSKPGYVFRTGEKGLGYYLDTKSIEENGNNVSPISMGWNLEPNTGSIFQPSALSGGLGFSIGKAHSEDRKKVHAKNFNFIKKSEVGKVGVDELQDAKSLLNLQQEEIKVLKAQIQDQQLLILQQQSRLNSNQQQSLPNQFPQSSFTSPSPAPKPNQYATPKRSPYGITQRGTVCKNCIAIGGRCHWHR